MSSRRDNSRNLIAERPWKLWCGAAILLGAVFAAHPAHAALWKWTDANGRVVYSDIPPSGDVRAERVNGPSPPANPNALRDMVNQDAEFKKRQLQRSEDTTKAEKAQADATRRQDFCNQARGQLKALDMEYVQHVRVNQRGERIVMTPAMIRQERERIQTYLREQCQADR